MEPLLERVDAVLFDLDGTLVETNIDFPLMKREMIALAVDYGLAPEPLSGLDILAVVSTSAQNLTVMGRASDADSIRRRATEILEEIELRHAGATREVPGARLLVSALRSRRIRVGIVTRNCRKASELSLGMVGIAPDVLVTREDSNYQKPHPEPCVSALESLRARAEASVMVGDHTMDIRTGKAAGMKTIGFLTSDRPSGFFDEVAPDLVATDLTEVLSAIVGRDS